MLCKFAMGGITLLALMPTLGYSQDAVSATSERREASFRPTPLRGDQSQIAGRVLSLRDQMAENRVILLSPPGGGTLPPINLQQRSAQSRTRLRAQQTARAQVAAQTLRLAVAAPRTRRQLSHVLTYQVETAVRPSQRFLDIEAADRRRRLDALESRLGMSGLEVEVVDGRAIISGTAVDESRLSVLERIVLLEPGVDTVENRVVVVTQQPPESE
jgi:hypothetical protein